MILDSASVPVMKSRYDAFNGTASTASSVFWNSYRVSRRNGVGPMCDFPFRNTNDSWNQSLIAAFSAAASGFLFSGGISPLATMFSSRIQSRVWLPYEALAFSSNGDKSMPPFFVSLS